MKETQLQTPQRDQSSANRRSKSTADLNKNLRKVSKKRLSSAFKAASEEEYAVLETLKELPEVFDDHPFAESDEVSKKRLSSVFKAASEEDYAALETLKELPEVSDDHPFAESDEVSKKRLISVFKATSEEDYAALETLKEIPEVSTGSDENFVALVESVGTPSWGTDAVSFLTSPTLSSFSVVTDAKSGNMEADFFDEIKSIEMDMAIKYLREARIQVLKSRGMGSSKKILDALIKVVIEEFYGGAREEKGRLDKFLSGKANVVVLSLMMGICAIMLMVWLFKSDGRGFHTIGPTPT